MEGNDIINVYVVVYCKIKCYSNSRVSSQLQNVYMHFNSQKSNKLIANQSKLYESNMNEMKKLEL